MSFSGKMSFLAMLLVMAVSMSVAAPAKSGKVRYTEGDVTIQKKAKGDWNALRVGAKVQEKDMIRTLNAAQAIIALPDGSTISVEENSLVEFAQLTSENGVQQTSANIKSGKVRFDAQKQNAGSSFRFKTGTATAAIRGTDGGVGVTPNGKPLFMLSHGKMDIETDNGKSTSIVGGQTAIPSDDGFVVVETPSSGDMKFFDQLAKLLDDTTKTIEDVQKGIIELDADLQKQRDAVQERNKCEFEKLPDTVTTNVSTIKGVCPEGVTIEISGNRIKSDGKETVVNVDWAPSASGDKKFIINCSIDNITYECGSLNTVYVAPVDTAKVDTVAADTTSKPLLQLNTPSQVRICETGAVTFEGVFDTTGASNLVVKLGKYTSPNLVPLSAGGEFSHTVSVNDKNGYWNESKATVDFSSSRGTASETVELNVDKTCKDVNTKAPVVQLLAYDEKTCVVSISAAGFNDDMGLLSLSVDGNKIKDIATSKNVILNNMKVLLPGLHLYRISAEDQAHNKSSIEKQLGCYPANNAKINVNGGKYERMRVPPAPGKNQSFHKSLRFGIKNVPGNDYVHIKRVVVKQGSTILLEKKGEQIDDINYDVPVELTRGEKNVFDIIVEMKHGEVLTEQKTYEVR